MKRLSLFIVLAALSTGAFAQTFSSPLSTEKKPWTRVPEISSNDYKFVIIPDKTGGEENGMFEQAIQDANKLAPDFVITIGDLIGGYYTDVKYCERDWKDIFGRLEKLDAPFFLVGGNHDLTNQLQTEDYLKRFGATYYSFSIGPDLFLVLNTEEHGGRSISDEQVEYFRGVLKGWDGRHIYVFMHSPLWNPENHDGYEYIDEMLQGHQYTVFSGHTHQYYYEKRNGMEYYTLATAGGGSDHRGQLIGEFDHITLVSAREGNPMITTIPLGVFVPNNIVDKTTMPLINWMTGSNFARCPYMMLDSAAPEEFEIAMTLKNPNDQPLEYQVRFQENGDLVFEKSTVKGTLDAKSEKVQTIKVKNPKGVEPGKIIAETECSYILKGQKQPVAGKLEIFTDYVREVPKSGKLTICCKDPYDVSESWDWHGVDDGWFDFDVEKAGKNLVVTVRTHDDIRALDKVTVFLESGGKSYEETFEPEAAQFKLPMSKIKDGKFSLNVKFKDNDDQEEGDPSVLWWRSQSHKGQFIISK